MNYVIKIHFRLRSLTPIVFIIAITLFQDRIEAQPKTNLEVFNILIDSASALIEKKIPGSDEEILLSLTFGGSYDVLKNYFYSSITSQRKKILLTKNSDQTKALNITLTEAKIEYHENIKDGLFGDFYTIRSAKITGSYVYSSVPVLSEGFVYGATDTILTSELQNVENLSYPFTTAEKPVEPFFSSLFEPIVAVGTTALAVILFFTIRSK